MGDDDAHAVLTDVLALRRTSHTTEGQYAARFIPPELNRRASPTRALSDLRRYESLRTIDHGWTKTRRQWRAERTQPSMRPQTGPRRRQHRASSCQCALSAGWRRPQQRHGLLRGLPSELSFGEATETWIPTTRIPWTARCRRPRHAGLWRGVWRTATSEHLRSQSSRGSR
jgi:hypothetical protein